MIKMNSYQVGVFDPSVASALVRGVLEVLVAELVLADEFALAGFELPVSARGGWKAVFAVSG